jgi:hypothetical protein
VEAVAMVMDDKGKGIGDSNGSRDDRQWDATFAEESDD